MVTKPTGRPRGRPSVPLAERPGRYLYAELEALVQRASEGGISELKAVGALALMLSDNISPADNPMGFTAPVVVNPAVQAAPARPPTIAEVAAEQVRRAVRPAAVDAATPVSGPGPDLSELGDDELDRLKVYLREVGGAADV